MSHTAQFSVPQRHEVSEKNQAVFDKLNRSIGMVPNIYAAMAHSNSALSDYLAYDNRKSSLSSKEREIVNLVASQINGCAYCLAAHTAIGQKVGFTAEQILDIRSGRAPFDDRLDALAQFVRAVVERRGKESEQPASTLFAAGYTEENLVDIVLAVSGITATNYLHNITEVPVDFPTAPAL